MKVIGLIIAALFVIVVLGFLWAIPVYYLWNWVAVDVLNLKSITLLQAWGLSMLSAFLFKSTSFDTKD